MLIDTHTHLNADQFAEDVHETIERARCLTDDRRRI